VDAFMCYKQKCKVVSLNLAHPVDTVLANSVKVMSSNHWQLSPKMADRATDDDIYF